MAWCCLLALFISNPAMAAMAPPSPEVDDIPDQTIQEGAIFHSIDLDAHVLDEDTADSEIIWDIDSSNDEITIHIEQREAYIDIPDENWNGSTIVTFKATDPDGQYDQDTALFTVEPVNDAPTALEDSYETGEDVPLAITAPGVLQNDTDVDNDALSAVLLTGVTHGSLTLHSDGSFIYTPDPDYHGPDSFTYKAYDGDAFSEKATVFIDVGLVNDAPVVNNPLEDVEVDEDAPQTAIDVADTFADVDILTNQDSLTLSLAVYDNDALVTAVLDGTTLTLTYPPDQNGVAFITVQATDQEGLFVQDTFKVTVFPVNDTPLLDIPIQDIDVSEDNPSIEIRLLNIFSDIDVDTDQDRLTFSVEDNYNPGLIIADIDGSVLTLHFLQDKYGETDVTVLATDLAGAIAKDTFKVIVDAVNDAPIAVDDRYETPEDTLLDISDLAGVLQNDTDVENDNLSVVFDLEGDVKHGSLTLNSDGSFIYTPDQDFNGYDEFTYRANDGNLPSDDRAKVTIVVGDFNDPPTLEYPILDVEVDEDDQPFTIDLQDTFSDVDIATNNDKLTLSVILDPDQKLISADINGNKLTLHFLQDQFGVTDVTVHATDLAGAIAEDTFKVIVDAVNDAPIAVDDSYSVDEDMNLEVAAPGVFQNDTDVENDSLTVEFEIENDVSYGTLVLNSDGSFTYTPDLNFNGFDDFSYWADDGDALSEHEALVTIEVGEFNDAPTLANPIEDVIVDEDAPATTIELADTFADVDIATNNDRLTLSVAENDNPDLLQAKITGTTLTLSYLKDQFGEANITIQAKDRGNESVQDSFKVTVHPVNDAPIIVLQNPAPFQIKELSPKTITTENLTIYDPDNTAFTLSIEASDEFSVDGLTITPLPGVRGMRTIGVRVNDGELDSEPFNFQVDVHDDGKPCSMASSPSGIEGPGDVIITYTAHDSYADETCGTLSTGDGLGRVELWVKTPGADSFAYAATISDGSTEGQFTYTMEEDGLYYFYTMATDTAGNLEDLPLDEYDTTTLHAEKFSGYAILALGDTPSEYTDSYTLTTNNIYKRLIDRHFSVVDNVQDPLDHIKYFHPYAEAQSGEDGLQGLTYKEALNEAITGWAVQKMTQLAGPLYIVLTGHGEDTDVFHLSQSESITADELNSTLETLESFMEANGINQPLVLILGFSFSGSFIDNLSKAGRVILTSSTGSEISFQGPSSSSGALEGDFFLRALFEQWTRNDRPEPLNLKSAFELSVRHTEEYADSGQKQLFYPYFDTSRQHPLLDDNGEVPGSNDLNPSGSGHIEDFSTGEGPLSIDIDDFNQDERLDMAVIHQNGSIAILLQDDQGLYPDPNHTDAGEMPVTILSNDFNQDELSDLVSVNSGGNDVTVHMGHGDGTFAAAVHYPVGLAPSDLAAGDVNSDGLLDLAVTNMEDDTVAILHGNGDGTFQAAFFLAAGSAPAGIVVNQFNAGDDHADMVVINQQNDTVSIFLGNGDGTFKDADGDSDNDGTLDEADGCPNDPLKTDPDPCGCGILETDSDGDGTPDCNDGCPQDPLNIEPECNAPSEDLCPEDENKTLPGICGCGNVDTDTDNDNVPDCFDRCPEDPHKVQPGSSSCGEVDARSTQFGTIPDPSDLIAADLDGDTHLDLVVTSMNTGTISIHMGNGDGTFHDPLDYDVGASPADVIALDFDEDGNLDLAAANSDSDIVFVLRGIGDGTFESAAHYRTGNQPVGLAAADIDKDGIADLAVANNGSGSITVMFTGLDEGSDNDLPPDGAEAAKLILGHPIDMPRDLTIEKTGVFIPLSNLADPDIPDTLAAADDVNAVTLWMEVNNSTLVGNAWVEIHPPDMIIGNGPDTVVVNPIRADLAPIGGDIYEIEVAEFQASGRYRLFFFVQDLDGKISSVALPDSYSYATSHYTNNQRESQFTRFVYKQKIDNQLPEFHSFVNVENDKKMETGNGFRLAWSAAVDPDGGRITYTIEITDNADNANILFKQEGITNTHFFFPAHLFADLLEQKVQVSVYAVDEHGGRSEFNANMSANTTIGTGTAIDGVVYGFVYNQINHRPVYPGKIIVGNKEEKLYPGGYYLLHLPVGSYTLIVDANGYKLDINSSVKSLEAEVTIFNIGLIPIDSDGDGYPDHEDYYPDDPSEWWNTDYWNDDIGNNADDDDDGDGMPDEWENKWQPHLYAPDSIVFDAYADLDGDGCDNITEYDSGYDPRRKDCNVNDRDGDGIPDDVDPDDDNDTMLDWWEEKYNLKKYVDDRAEDPDGDGISNIDEYGKSNPRNAVPVQPTLISPADGALDVEVSPLLATGPFEDSYPLPDTHISSRWQVGMDAGFTNKILDIHSDFNLTTLALPKLLLAHGNTYFWRVQFTDKANETSVWSEVNQFTTASKPDDEEENDDWPPEDLDMDGNGIPDRDQDDMGCVLDEMSGKPMCIKVPDTVLSIDAVRWIDPAEIVDTDNRPLTLPFGLISFKLSVVPGSESEITLLLSEAVAAELELYKYDAMSGWYPYADYSQIAADRMSLALKLKDGGFGDGDGTQNGVVLDPSGLGSSPRSLYGTYDGIDGNSPIEGCFIASSADIDRFWFGVAFIAASLGLFLTAILSRAYRNS